MSEANAGPEDSASELDREAASWFARMRAPDADASRKDFETWLAAQPEHRGAYNRAAEIFAMGKLLGSPAAAATGSRSGGRAGAALVACAACLLAVGGWMLLHTPDTVETAPFTAGRAAQRLEVSTIAGEARLVRLTDGSVVRLGSGTTLIVDFSAGRRSLRLSRGLARFEVAHEARPFMVLAGGGSVTARGTIFDVALAPSGQIDVRLLQGAVDVALPPGSTRGSTPSIRRLAAGESISYVPDRRATPATGQSPAPVPREFESVAVAVLIDEANRIAARPIRLAEPTLGSRRVSGRFSVDDTALLADRLSALFGVWADKHDPEEIVLRPQP